MKTHNFLRELKAMQYETVKFSDAIRIRINQKTVAVISMVDQYEFDTRFHSFEDLLPGKKGCLYLLLDEYARTPVDEREEPLHEEIIEAYKHLLPGDRIIRNIEGTDFVMFDTGDGGTEYVEMSKAEDEEEKFIYRFPYSIFAVYNPYLKNLTDEVGICDRQPKAAMRDESLRFTRKQVEELPKKDKMLIALCERKLVQ